MMQPRTNNQTRFSTFLKFSADRAQGWITDGSLHRQMTRLVQQQGEESEHYWVLYWHQRWQQTSPLPQSYEHLVAYLQESCYWSAQKLGARLLNANTSLFDLFQMAIAHSEQVLKGYDPHQGFALKSYASVLFTNAIRSTLRQQKAADLCTDWTLLRKTSQKRLQAALKTQGLTDSIIHEYLWAWDCYKVIYVPQQQDGYSRLAPPSEEQWDAIATLYNQGRLSQCGPTTASQSPTAIAQWLKSCGQAVRRYLYPNPLSLNRPRNPEEGGEFLDDLIQDDQAHGLDHLEAVEALQERQTQQQALQEQLIAILSQLKPDAQHLLSYYYRDRLKQQDIALALNIKQYAVSRQLARVRKEILLSIAAWSKAELHISLDATLLNSMNTHLEAWLEQYFHPAAVDSNLPTQS